MGRWWSESDETTGGTLISTGDLLRFSENGVISGLAAVAFLLLGRLSRRGTYGRFLDAAIRGMPESHPGDVASLLMTRLRLQKCLANHYAFYFK
jgi:hypothetical protein